MFEQQNKNDAQFNAHFTSSIYKTATTMGHHYLYICLI